MHKVLSKNISDDDKQLTTFLNLYSYMIARKKRDVLKEFNILIDGIILVWLLRIFGFSRVSRFSFDMTSMAPIVFKEAIKKNQQIYFIGSKPNVIDNAITNIKSEFSGLNICGFNHGYLSINERISVFKEIIALKVDIVICGMGTPLQEEFLLELKQYGWEGKGYTCGGFLHQTAADIKYYPKWVDKYNLRGFYRMYDEPYLLKRYFLVYPWALLHYLVDSYSYNIEKRRNRKGV